MSGHLIYLNVLTKPHFRQGSVLLNMLFVLRKLIKTATFELSVICII